MQTVSLPHMFYEIENHLDVIDCNKEKIHRLEFKEGVLKRVPKIHFIYSKKGITLAKIVIDVMNHFIKNVSQYYLKDESNYVDCKINMKERLKELFSNFKTSHINILWHGIIGIDLGTTADIINLHKRRFDYLDLEQQAQGQLFTYINRSHEQITNQLTPFEETRNMTAIKDLLEDSFLRKNLLSSCSDEYLKRICQFFFQIEKFTQVADCIKSLTRDHILEAFYNHQSDLYIPALAPLIPELMIREMKGTIPLDPFSEAKKLLVGYVYDNYWLNFSRHEWALIPKNKIFPQEMLKLVKNKLMNSHLRHELIQFYTFSTKTIINVMGVIINVEKYKMAVTVEKKKHLNDKILSQLKSILPIIQKNDIYMTLPLISQIGNLATLVEIQKKLLIMLCDWINNRFE